MSKKIQIPNPIKVVETGTPTTENLAKGQVAIKEEDGKLVLFGNTGGEKIQSTAPKKYDYQKLISLTEKSSDADIRAALTPIGETEVVWPNIGDEVVFFFNSIVQDQKGLFISVINETARYHIVFIYNYAFYGFTINCRNDEYSISNHYTSAVDNTNLIDRIRDLNSEMLKNRVNIDKLKPMYDFSKINALTGESGNDEIEAAITQLQTSTMTATTTAPTAGALLVDATSLAPLAAVTDSSSDASTMTEVFSYTHGGVKYTVEISGEQGALTAKVTTQAVTQRRYDCGNFSTLVNDGKTSDDIKAALTPIGETEPVWPALNDVLVTKIDNEYKPVACFINVIPLTTDNYVYMIGVFYFITIVTSFQIIKEADGTYKIGEKSSIDSFTLSTLQSTVTQQGTQIQQVQQKADKPLHDLFVSLGAVDNGDGTYTMNEVTDLTYEDLTNSYKAYVDSWNRTDLTSAYENATIRTNFINSGNLGGWNSVSIYAMLSGARMIETLSFDNLIYINTLFNAFRRAEKLKKIIGRVIFSKNFTGQTSEQDFLACYALESIQLELIDKNMWFQDSPKLSKDSILYMIQNSDATSAITITLHPTAYAMAIADSDIQAALEEKTFVSLSQGEPTTTE